MIELCMSCSNLLSPIKNIFNNLVELVLALPMSNSGKATRTGMGHGDPPSPPLSDGQDLQYGLHHLQHHNAVAQYQPNPYAYDSNTGPYGSHTNFSSPEQPQLSINQYEVNRYRNTVDGSQSGYKYVRKNLLATSKLQV